MQVYYKNQYHSGYKRDEEALRKIFKHHIFQINVEIELLIYYKSKKTSNIIMQNNLSNSKLPDKLRSHIVYEFTCSVGECVSSNNSYIGRAIKEKRFKGPGFKISFRCIAYMKLRHRCHNFKIFISNQPAT